MYEKEITAGIALLDEKLPGWYNRINLQSLDMNEKKAMCFRAAIF